MTSIANGISATTDPAELDKFATIGGAWWDTTGPMAPLHKFNPVRIAFIRDEACRHFQRDPNGFEPLLGLRTLDVGCGGGLLAEPLARLGGLVTGIDPIDSNIEAARTHVQAAGLEVSYCAEAVETLRTRGHRFDLVVASEVIEHVSEPADFTDALASLTRPGGMLVLTTLSRTLASFAEAIVGAEYLLGWLPRGTHNWRRFLTPAELSRLLRGSGMRPVAIRGASYDGARDAFRLERDPSVNYLLAAVRT